MEVAIVGIACRFPQADNSNAFWENIVSQKYCISEIPEFRWDWKKYFGDPRTERNKSLSKWASFVNDVDAFDAHFFGLLPKVVNTMDPQQRFMLELSWTCLENASISPSSLRGSKVGVFCGAFNHDYKELQESQDLQVEAHHSTGTASAIIANRISHFFDFKGPSFPIDTACSSSLNAVHSAIQAMEFGDCEMALAGGVNFILTPTRHISFSKMGMLSPTGHCSTFDDSADGYVRGEGAAFLLLKPLTKALDDGDSIWGVIKGSAINHCGETYTLTYPSAEAQAEVIVKAHQRANLPLQSVNYVETHGTGTPKGDPIEFEGLKTAYKTLAKEQGADTSSFKCGLSAVKTNIGHLEAAAGIAGIIKVLLSFKNKTLAPLQNFKQLNRRISLENTPFYVVDKAMPWQGTSLGKGGKLEPLRAGVSSFGFGGTNAHIILEEPPEPVKFKAIRQPFYLITLSAKSVTSLVENKHNLLSWLKAEGNSHRLIDISATLLMGRDHLTIRQAYVVKSIEDLTEQLEFELNNDPEKCERINSDDLDKLDVLTKHAQKIIDELSETPRSKQTKTSFTTLCELYLDGADCDFKALFKGKKVLKVRLPEYAFDREKYWIERSEFSVSNNVQLHPLVHENTSNLEEQRFRSHFSGNEYFLRDHQVGGKRLLPAAAYLEMACSALAHALDNTTDAAEDKTVELRDLVFLRPFIVAGEEREICVKIFPNFAPPQLPEGTVYVNFDIASGFENSSVDTNCHGSAFLTAKYEFPAQNIQWNSEASCFDAENCYGFLRDLGFEYGPSHQSITQFDVSGNSGLVKLELPESLAEGFDQYTIHPSLVDGALQAAVALLSGIGSAGAQNTSVLPFAIDQVSIHKALPKQCWAYVELRSNALESKTRKVDIQFYAENPLENTSLENKDGELSAPIFEIKGLNCRESQHKNELAPTFDKAEKEEWLQTEKDSYYACAWRPAQQAVSAAEPGRVLLVGEESTIAKAEQTWSQNLRFASAQFMTLSFGNEFSIESNSHFKVRNSNLEDCQALFEHLKEIDQLPDQIINIHNPVELGNTKPSSVLTAPIENIFVLVKGSLKRLRKARWLSIAQGSVDAVQPLYQGLSGFYKTVKLEKPSFVGRVVLFDQLNVESEVLQDRLLAELKADDVEVDIAYQGEQRFTRQFMPFNDFTLDQKLKREGDKPAFRKNGRYLITGGLGALGLLVARHLIEEYSAQVYLTGRSNPNQEKIEALNALCKGGASVHYVQLDVADYSKLRTWVEQINAEGAQLHGILHSAGVIEDNFIIKKDLQAFQRVISPKVLGTLALDLATQDQPIEAFVTFSSVTGILGNLGQCDYGYGNSFEDYFSFYRNQLVKNGERTGNSCSINWPYWKQGGMQLGEKEEEILFKNFGITPLENKPGLEALEFAIKHNITQMAVLEGDQNKVCQVLNVKNTHHGANRVIQSRSVVANQSSVLSSLDIKDKVLSHLIDTFSQALKIPKERFDLHSSFQTYGFDSVVMIDMVNLLEKKLSGLPRTLFFEYQNLNDLSEFLAAEYKDQFSQVKSEAPAAHAVDSNPQNQVRETSARFIGQVQGKGAKGFGRYEDDIAIVGISGRFPEAENISEFWNNLKQGRDCITEVPAERGWGIDALFNEGGPNPGLTYCKWGGFLKGVDQFDPLFFNISPKEAEEMDPHERLFLECVAKAIGDAGYRPDRLAPARGVHDSPVGVYAGVMWGDYHLYGMDSNSPSAIGHPHSFYWAVANRVSYQFNFSGPSITIDTACSSSLTAIHLASDALKKGEIDAGIAGGVNLSLHPLKYTLLSNMRFLSTDGRCRSFGVGGDGYVPGEAVGAVILKRKSDAIRDGDHIYGIVKSTAINHGGRTSGFTVPNPNRQAALVKDAVQSAGINPRHISYVEAHGTGTSLGDPIEISGLTKAFEQEETQYCAIGSAKSNIGHAEASAGVAGLMKILLQMKHRQIVPSLHSKELNPYAKIESSPFYVQQTLGEWVEPVQIDAASGQTTAIKRIAALSSFGAGGANGHMIVEEYQDSRGAVNEPDRDCLILLSGRKESSLRTQAQELHDYINQELSGQQGVLKHVAYTLQVGRVPLEFGCAFIVDSMQSLSSVLARIAGGEQPTGVLLGKRSRSRQDLSETSTESRDWSALAQAWMNGEDLRFELMYQPGECKRVPLPSYVFEKSRYWVKHSELGSTGSALQSLSALIDRNISSFDEQLFEKTFRANESYLRDHKIGGSAVLPGVAYLEMVLQAAQKSSGERKVLGLSGVKWLKPVIINDQSVAIKIGFYPERSGIAFEIFDEEAGERRLYCSGELVLEELSSSSVQRLFQTPVPQTPANLHLARHLAHEQLNQAFEALGFDFGESFQIIKEVQYTDTEALGLIEPISNGVTGFTLIPAIMDASIRVAVAVGGFLPANSGMPLPVGVERVIVHRALTASCRVYARKQMQKQSNALRSSYDVFIQDLEGNDCVSLFGFEIQRVARLEGTKPKAKVALAKAENTAATQTAAVSSAAQANVGQSVVAYLKQLIAQTTKVPEAQIDTAEALERYGIDSVMIMSMNEKLREKFGDDIPQTLFFEYQNIDDLAEFFSETYPDHFGSVPASASESRTVQPEPAASHKPQELAASAENQSNDRELATEFLLQSLSEVTKLPVSEIDVDEPLEKYGVDSVMIMNMNEKIAQVFGDNVSKTLFFEYQEISGLADYFVENHAEDIQAKLSKTQLKQAPQTNTIEQSKTIDSGEAMLALESSDHATRRLAEEVLQAYTDELSVELTEALLHQPLNSLGLDAEGALLIQARLRKRFPTADLPSLLRFRSIHHCISELTGYNFTLEEEQPLAQSEPLSMPSVLSAAEPSRSAVRSKRRLGRFAPQAAVEEEIAIVGLAGQYPQANTLDEFWNNLSGGKDCITEVPADRWDFRKTFDPDRSAKGKIYGKWGGFLDSIDQFDPDFFRITLREAEKMDPQERLFLQTAAQCFEDAGFSRKTLKSSSVGVYVGVMWGLYQHIDVSPQQLNFGKPGNSFASIANRVSYVFDLNGPSLALDTMCSSSITAIHFACQSIRNGDCQVAIAGGVNLASHPLKYELLSQEQFLSSDGRCRAFGDGGTGYVPGEGVGAVLLKPYSKALEDGDLIYGVVHATALNHGGKTNGYTVPNQKAQTNVIAQALKRSGWSPESLSYIEAHGTGTSLGDPIEVEGLVRALNSVGDNGLAEDFECDIGSVKSNIGHLESAAGIAALTKVLLQMKHRKIVPSLHSSTLNSNINFNATPLRVTQGLKDWQASDNVPLRAGISSFGAGGSNSHLLLEEFDASTLEPRSPVPRQTVLVLFSAGDETRLKAYIQQVLPWLQQQSEKSDWLLQRLAWTSQVGRDQLAQRLAVVTDNFKDLEEALSCYLTGQEHRCLVLSRDGKGGDLNRIIDTEERQQLQDAVLAKQQWERLALLWASALDIDWASLSAQLFPAASQAGLLRKVSFPTKPFITQGIWVDVEEDAGQIKDALHPLVDRNRSTLFEQVYSKVFSGEEFYLADHIVNSGTPRCVLPGVAYLELARVCGEQAVANEYAVRHIRNLLWAAPIEIVDQQAEEIQVRLMQNEETLEFEVRSASEISQVYCQGELEYELLNSAQQPIVDLAALKGQTISTEDFEEIYLQFLAMGFEYGPSFQVTQRRYRLEGHRALAELRIPAHIASTMNDYALHPSLMDAAVRTALAADYSADEMPKEPIVPFGVEDVEILQPLPPHCFALAFRSEDQTSQEPGADTLRKYHVWVMDAQGKVLVRLHNFSARSFVKNKQPTVNLYEYHWANQALAAPEPFSGTAVLALGIERGAAAAIAHRIKAPVVLVDWSEQNNITPVEQDENLLYTQLRLDDAAAMHRLLVHLRDNQLFPDVILIDPPDTEIYDQLPPVAMLQLFNLFRSCEKVKPLSAYKLVFSQCESEDINGALNSCVSGFAKSLLSMNHRMQMVSMVVEDNLSSDTLADYLLAEALAGTQNLAAEVRYRDGQRLTRQMRTHEPALGDIGMPLVKGGVYLITGGLGKLGLVFARYLAENWGAKLVLTGRSELDEQGQQAVAELEGLGAKVFYQPCDTAEKEQVQALIAAIEARFGPLQGVLHSAGVADSKNLLEQDLSEFNAILAPKLNGTLFLDEATAESPLQFFVLFSSISAVVGDLGSGSYACANRFLDAFAEWRSQQVDKGLRKGRSLSINWPLWATGGMEIPEDQMAVFEFSGLQPLSEEDGVKAFEQLLVSPEAHNILVAAGDAEKLRQYLRLSDDLGLSENAELNDESSADNQQVEENTQVVAAKALPVPMATSTALVSEQISAAPPAQKSVSGGTEQEQALYAWLQAMVASITKMDAEKIDRNSSFERFGIDSVMLMELQNRLREDFEKLPKTALFEHDSLGKLGKYLQQAFPDIIAAKFGEELSSEAEHSEVDSGADGQAHSVERFSQEGVEPFIERRKDPLRTRLPMAKMPTKRTVQGERDIAVIGIGARFPKADNLQSFWDLIINGESTVEQIPESRWSAAQYYAPQVNRVIDKTHSKWGAFIDGIDLFDPEFFRMSQDEACKLDPQVKLMLELAWMAFEDAAYTPQALKEAKQRVGVYMGTMADDFSRIVQDTWREQGQFMGPGFVASELANRLSLFLDLQGPSLSVQTACSSSATALHIARKAILDDECEYALAGGVNLSLHPNKYLMLQDLKVLSPDGREATFDEQANGLVPSEGAGIVMLKRLDRAQADGDHIYGVIKSSVASHTGTGAGQFIPNIRVMADTAAQAMREAGVEAKDMSYIECHGTGTDLGDPIELKALEMAISENTDRKGFCTLGTKANFGHMEAASGVCSLIKVLLCMQNQQLAPCANLQEVTSVYEPEHSPFTMPVKPQRWLRGERVPVYAGINSFGMGGSKVFMVTASAPEPSRLLSPQNQPEPIVVSAPSNEQLRQVVSKLCSHFSQPINQNVALRDVAFSLQTGRTEFTMRVLFLAKSIPEFLRLAQQWLDQSQADGVVVYQTDSNNKQALAFSQAFGGSAAEEYLEKLVASKDLNTLATLWVMGVKVPWRKLYTGEQAHRLSLPGYSWQRVDTHLHNYSGFNKDTKSSAQVQIPAHHQEAPEASAFKPGEWFYCDRQALDIPSLVVGTEARLANHIFSGEQWKQSYWADYLQEFAKQTAEHAIGNSPSSKFSARLSFEADFVETLQRFSQAKKIEVQTLFIAAWSLVLSRLSKERCAQFACRVPALSNETSLQVPMRLPCQVRMNALNWLETIQIERLIKHDVIAEFEALSNEPRSHLFSSQIDFDANYHAGPQDVDASLQVDIQDREITVQMHLGSEQYLDHSAEQLLQFLSGFVLEMAKNSQRNPAALPLRSGKENNSKNFLRVLDLQGENS